MAWEYRRNGGETTSSDTFVHRKNVFSRILHSKSKENQYKIKARLPSIEGKSRFVTWYFCSTAVIERSQLCPYSIVSAGRPHFPRVLVETSRLRVFIWCEPAKKLRQTSGECRRLSGFSRLRMAPESPFRTSE